jgi:anti-sigma B factor antagonist
MKHTLEGITLLELSGRFDANAAPDIADWLAAHTSAPPARVVVTLSAVNFIDSTALGVLVRGMKRCREHGGDLRLCELQQPVRIIFELTRLDKTFRIFANQEEAVQSFWADTTDTNQ